MLHLPRPQQALEGLAGLHVGGVGVEDVLVRLDRARKSPTASSRIWARRKVSSMMLSSVSASRISRRSTSASSGHCWVWV